MFITEFFGFFSLSAFASWGFLMAFFFNAFVFTLGIKRNTTLLLSSFIMMLSYTISNYFFTWLSVENSVYLDWALYDYATIAVLVLAFYIFKKTTPSFLYIITGLILNSIFSLSMYLDIYINENRDAWFLWDLYAFSVNIIDLIMIVVLIVDRDFLGLHKLKNKFFKGSSIQPENNFS
ncbi:MULTISPECIES: hypothetical protein [Pseudoalteromonas]|jgi:heme O synthase-like polyprenyltransferase|uniref:hypothetical protein n=1 Tax=Pseudoalteromonas TaxID=53246 RepID=UPI000381A2D9|nr:MULTISPECIES: hypothetical protein [Pseudoalteromonas]MDN3406917.1 hypothetical protein [Pseudoalteromonas sp. APC 3218]MDN3409362.1 hypothetical protein [Pseudoalteromonas sp. APC 3894]MDN3414188.1 hypothetical protein [Pseudoalteromonas sp. APC 3250]MDN3417895.1 hypothetical protein [Pseudoalteromonas sp. APC 3227]MDN3421324.1 hypothetical protein [Pseudoalteromonas sp. APC 3895]|tara:strand:- start:1648 stop:2181 length:534 start_codon:yes stop_codon:yes gene_type:complete